MLYDKESGVISVGCREFVSVARRGISTLMPMDSDEPEYFALAKRHLGDLYTEDEATELCHPFKLGKYNARLVCKPLMIRGDKLWIAVAVDSSPKRPRKESVAEARGEGFVMGYALCEKYGYEAITLNYVYVNPTSGEKNELSERITRKKLTSFFEKCVIFAELYAAPEVERVTLRLPSMEKVKFPYENVRDGQSELVHSVYKNIARGGKLYATAPTGTGKTVSVLFPAVRALGAGKCDKIFYFTPKTTTAIAAKECLEELAREGAKIKAVTISAKERVCRNRLACRKGRNHCENTKLNKLCDAALELYKRDITVVTAEDIQMVAEQFRICPYELSLTYAEICDAVICDLNYLFDPAVYIRRFFTEGGRYAFLIDEAHNLPDRAREMYSAEISSYEIGEPAKSLLVGEHSSIKCESERFEKAFYDLLYPLVKEEAIKDEDGIEVGATHLTEIPTELYSKFEDQLKLTEGEFFRALSAQDADKDARVAFLRQYYYKIKRFYKVMSDFNSSYELFIFLENGQIRAKCFCIDPSGEISKRLEKGSSATFFSGTLTPLYYYKSVLGGDGSSDTLELDAPFDPSQLSVSIMDKISTRLLSRQQTLLEVCRVIAATVSAKRGNYMIFSPSFAYSDAIASVFASKYPKIKTIRQRRDMTAKEKEEFLLEFSSGEDSYLIAFCVLGGIYSEGIDLAGDKLIGAVIVGIGIPSVSYEREAISAYYNERYDEGKQFAYIYPGVNRVLQAAGRVIRRDGDRGVIVLIDDRFDDPIYKTVIPKLWKDMKFLSTPKELRAELDEFWNEDGH